MKRKNIYQYGDIIGKFTFVKDEPTIRRGKKTHRMVSVKCECGNECIRRIDDVLYGATISCGCKSIAKLKHGESSLHLCTKEYATWLRIKHRCTEKFKQRKDYFDRGITVCERWIESYDNFLSDMGRSPTKIHTIERRDNDLGYSPENCYWATRKEQSLNRGVVKKYEYNGQTKNLHEWEIETGIPSTILWDRIEWYNWSVEKALTTKWVKRNYKRKGDLITIKEALGNSFNYSETVTS